MNSHSSSNNPTHVLSLRTIVKRFALAGRSWLSGVALLGTLTLGCAEEQDKLPAIAGGVGHSAWLGDSCSPGSERECGYTLEQDHDVTTCFFGMQTCQEDETWGPCTDGGIVARTSPGAKSLLSLPPSGLSSSTQRSTQAMSTAEPGDCLEACDPYCLHFEELNPDLGTPVGGGGGSTEFPGAPSSCDHGLCDTSDGTPLDPTCDPCVQDVCDVRPSCCSTEWDSTCADLVYTECAGTSPPLDLCDFGVFSLNGVVTANRPSAGAAIGAVGDVTIGTDATPSMIVTTGNLHINSPNGKNITAPGGVWVGKNATAQNGGGAQYTADWHVGGSIALNGGNTINGDVYAGSSPTGVTITGNTYVPSPAPEIDIPMEIPALPASCPGGPGYNISNSTQTVTPGNYGNVTLSNGSKLVLNGPGRYTFTTLNGSSINNGGIQIGTTATSGTYEVIVCGDFRLGNYANIIDSSANPSSASSRTPVLAAPERLVLYVGGDVNFGTNNNFAGVLIVPNGKYTAADRSSVNGMVWAKDFATGTDMNASQLDAATCEALELTTPTRECPVVDEGIPPGSNEPCETGADCQMNQRCTETVTAACEHSKCLPGDALSETCDRCVEMICDADPSCCSDEWSESCVDMVGTVCDASCGAVTGCTHDMCAVGGTLSQGCDSENCTDTVCSNASTAYCCDDSDPRGWDQNCVDQAVATCSGTPSGSGGAALCGYAIHHASGYNGSASVGGGTVGTGATIPSRSFGCGSGSSTLGSTTITPGSYGNLTLGDWSGATLSLQAGTYYVNSLKIGAGTRLAIPSSGTVVLNVCGNVTFGQQSQITGLATGSDQLRLELYTNGNLSAGPQAQLGGVIIGGNTSSDLSLNGPTTHNGLLWSAGTVTMTNNWGSNPTVNNSIPAASCESAGFAPPACPVTTDPATVDESGVCVSNDDGWVEPYCNGYDLAADYVCGNQVPVCNHGDSNFPGGSVTVGYWNVEDRQFAVEAPDTSLGGSCTDNLPAIAPGECANLDCTLPPGADYTLMIDPEDDLGECNAHRLDNWTWKDEDYACGGQTSFAEYEYEAKCPDGSSALWKTLTWITSVPYGSSVEFSGKVGDDLPDLNTKSYITLGTASPEGTDTTSCTVGDDNCPIGLTDELNLGNVQGQFLSIRVDCVYDGGAPSVSDWAVSYTCRYDE